MLGCNQHFRGARLRAPPDSRGIVRDRSFHMRRRRFILGFAVVLCLALVGASQAGARAPGVNGQIAYDLSGNGVVTANADGTGANLLVPNTCCGEWSPDGSKLVLPYGTADDRIGPATINAD